MNCLLAITSPFVYTTRYVPSSMISSTTSQVLPFIFSKVCTKSASKTSKFLPLISVVSSIITIGVNTLPVYPKSGTLMYSSRSIT